jgi:hypothetical protein
VLYDNPGLEASVSVAVLRYGPAVDLDGPYVWITTRRLRPGSREEFSRAWKPSEIPDGMLRAYECYSADGNEVVGISIWDSPQSRDRYRLSDAEKKRRQAMAPFVLEETSGFYVGRELKIPGRSPRSAA